MKNDYIIEFEEEPNIFGTPCQSCEEVEKVICYTLSGKGPFCSDCFGSLCDPDEALRRESQLEAYEL